MDSNLPPLHRCIADPDTPKIEVQTLLKWTSVKQLQEVYPSNGDTLLHVVARNKNYDILEGLLKHASQERVLRNMLQMKNNDGRTILDEAVVSDDTEVVNKITEVDRGFLHLPDNIGKILFLAAKKGDYKMVIATTESPSGPTSLLMAPVNPDISGSQAMGTILHVHIQYSEKPSTCFVEEILDICPELLLKSSGNGDSLLHVAFKSKHFDIARRLIELARGLPPYQAESRDRVLDEAIKDENIEGVNILIKEADYEFLLLPERIVKIMYLAARRGNDQMVTEIAKRPGGVTALQRALENPESIPEAELGDTFLHIHIKSSQTSRKFVERILDICPEILMKKNAKGDAPLHVAAKHGRHVLVKVLIDRANAQNQDQESQLLGSKNKEENTALHEAVRHGKREVVEILTKADPKISYSPNKAGETPLYLAASRGYYHMVHAILNNCRSATYEGPNGMTALHAAVMNSKIRDAEGVNRDAEGMNSNKGDAEGVNRDAAADSEKEGDLSCRVMEALLERKTDLTRKADQYGWTPLHYAAYHGHNDKVSLLLRYDKSVADIVDKDRKMTALHMAAGQGHKDVIENIISQCEECCEMKDNRGWNVLHFAMLSLNKKELVDLLTNQLVRGLIDNRDDKGNTPLHIRAAAYRDTFYLIRNRGAVNKQNISVEHILEYGFHELEEEIQLLVEDFGKGQYTKGVIRNDDYFEIQNERRKKYYEGLKETRSSQLLVATLIATVTFTAAFTIPGGYNSKNGSDQGTAILNRNLPFQLFIITDTVAMTLSLSAVFVHFIMSFEKFQKYQNLFTFASCLTMLSMGAVVFAFVTGIYSVLAPTIWLAITTCVLGLSFFPLVLCTLRFIYWRAFLEWLLRKWKLFTCPGIVEADSGNVLPTYVTNGN